MFHVKTDFHSESKAETMMDNLKPILVCGGALVGLVSQRDVLRYASATDEELPLSASSALLCAARAADIMTQQVETVEADEDLAVAARIMLDNKYGCLPVFEEGVLAGIITEADFVRLMADAGAPDDDA